VDVHDLRRLLEVSLPLRLRALRGHLTFEFEDCTRWEIDVGPGAAPPAAGGGAGGAALALTAPEAEVGRALVAAGDNGRLTMPEVAAAAGREPNSRLAALLASMRDRGLASGGKGEPGYGPTPLLHAALAREGLTPAG
jgi:hypothetical protein